MCATLNSLALKSVPAQRPVVRPAGGHAPGRGRQLAGLLGTWAVVLTMALQADCLGAADSVFAQRAEKAYQKARDCYRAEPANNDLVWQFARACFYWADFATNSSGRAALAEEGITACRQLLKRDLQSAAGHYYLAMNLGQLARTKTLGALAIVSEMEIELKAAIALNPKLHYAGPHLSLGILYRDAPGWPASIGNRSKAREHLLQAVKLSPDYPENRLILLESYLEWKDKSEFEAELQRVAEVMPQARKQFTGESWEEDWLDWNARWEKLKGKVSSSAP